MTKPSAGSFWDSWPAYILMIAAILFARFYVFEPFKIPSGSMEPTLFGHEDYGDRIVANKLAYTTPGQVFAVLGVSAALLGAAFVASKGWQRLKAIIGHGLVAVAVFGGIILAWSNGAVAGVPKRFDVVIFKFDESWEGGAPSQINYIKRLVGLPHDKLLISGGNLFKLNRKTDQYEIIRKWETSESLQDTLWYPVAKCWSVLYKSTDTDPYGILPSEYQRLSFPWRGVEKDTPGAKLENKDVELDGTAPVELTYNYPVTNIYLKQGLWPFQYVDMDDPDSHSKTYTCYVDNTWEGVRCPPNSKTVFFPLQTAGEQQGKRIGPHGSSDPRQFAKFYYGGERIVGDLKIELELNVESPGMIELQAGSDLHSALWRIPSDGAATPTVGVHAVKANVPQLSRGRHTLSLAYVDATVIARLDGREIERQLVEVSPPGKLADSIHSIARVRFTGLKGTVRRLDLFRDLYYTAAPEHQPHVLMPGSRQRNLRDYNDDGDYWAEVPADQFLMLGDNSPASKDGRVWGFVPRENLVGRGGFIWWPPSRWRLIR